MTWLRLRLIEAHFFCSGPIIGSGFVSPISKKNHRPVIIPGWWLVRECSLCGDVYSSTDDLLVPGLLPDPEIVREFEQECDGDLAA